MPRGEEIRTLFLILYCMDLILPLGIKNRNVKYSIDQNIKFPRSKCLLISWLQSPSAVILEPPKIKSLTLFPLFPHLFPMRHYPISKLTSTSEVSSPDVLQSIVICCLLFNTFGEHAEYYHSILSIYKHSLSLADIWAISAIPLWTPTVLSVRGGRLLN